jgi:hypothetical protein
MTARPPPVPPNNRSKKGVMGPREEIAPDSALNHPEPQNLREQGDTANIKQNTTNEGFFRGRKGK